MDIFEALNVISGALDYVFEEMGEEDFDEIAEAEDIIYIIYTKGKKKYDRTEKTSYCKRNDCGARENAAGRPGILLRCY